MKFVNVLTLLTTLNKILPAATLEITDEGKIAITNGSQDWCQLTVKASEITESDVYKIANFVHIQTGEYKHAKKILALYLD